MKTCNRCLENKNLSDFAMTSNIQYVDGHINTCKVCTNKRCKELRQSKAQPKKEKVKLTACKNLYAKQRRKNPSIKLAMGTRNLIYHSFKRAIKGTYKKSDKTENIIGCSISFFIDHLQLNFKDGMTLDNYGQWHIDHIKPLALAKTENDIYILNHYSNLQPLWATDNLKKGAKYDNTRSNI